MTNDYLVKKTYNSFMVISVLSVLAATLGILIDNVIAGKFLGQEALSTMSIVGSLSYVFSCVSNLCVIGGAIKAAQALGRDDKMAPSNYFSITLIFFALISLIVGSFSMLFPEQLAIMLGARNELIEPSVQFLHGYMWSIFPNLAMFSLNNFAKISGSPKLPLYSIIAMTLVDIVLDLLLVRWGMFGLGLATTLGYVAGLGISCLYFLKKGHTLHVIRPQRFFHELKDMMTAGLPTAAVRLGEGLRAIMLNHLLIITVGTGALAALNVRTQANNFFGAVTLGMGQSLLPVAGLFYGQGARVSLKDALWYSVRTGFFLNVIICVLLVLFASELASFFGIQDEEIKEMAALAIILLGISLPLRGINCALISYFQATGRENFATLLSSLQTFVLVCLGALLLIGPFAATGVWLSFILAEVITLLTIIAYATWQQKHFPKSFEDLMVLSPDYGRAERFAISIQNTVEEVIKAEQAATAYAEAKGVDKKKLYAISLMIEEVGTNIVHHAFTDKNKHWLDIFMLVNGDEIKLHFRDNGQPFDPIAYSDKNETGLGLKLIRSLSPDITYSYNLILNELDVRL